jgi:hypothetical protein
VDRIDERVFTDAGRQDLRCVVRGELGGPKRQLLDEAERGTKAPVDRGRPPVSLDRLPDFFTEAVRRDRAVGVRSERALVEGRDKGGEELAFRGTPI